MSLETLSEYLMVKLQKISHTDVNDLKRQKVTAGYIVPEHFTITINVSPCFRHYIIDYIFHLI